MFSYLDKKFSSEMENAPHDSNLKMNKIGQVHSKRHIKAD